MSILNFVFIVCLSLDICAVQEQVRSQVGKVLIGNTLFSWQVKGPGEFCEHIQKNLAESRETGQPNSFTIMSLMNKQTPAGEISVDGKLTITSEGESVTVKDLFSKVLFDTNGDKPRRSEKGLFDEGDGQDNEIQLQPGSSVTIVSCDCSRNATVIFDKLIKFTSEVDDSEFKARLSLWAQSRLVQVGTHDGSLGRKNQEIILQETKKEIETLDFFLEFDQEGREKLLGELSIAEHAKFLVSLREHGLTKVFGYNYFDFSRRLLKNKIVNLLKQETSKKVFDYNDLVWFEEIKKLSLEVKNVIEDILRGIIRAVPKNGLLDEWKASSSGIKWIGFNSYPFNARVDLVKFSPDGKNCEVELKDVEDPVVEFDSDEIKSDAVFGGCVYGITDPENENGEQWGFKSSFVSRISFSPDETKAIIQYKEPRTIIKYYKTTDSVMTVKLSSDKEIVKASDKDGIAGNIKDVKIELTANIKLGEIEKKIITYKDGSGKIIDLDVGEVIFEADNIKGIHLNSGTAEAVIVYKDGKAEIIDLADYNRGITFSELTSEQLLFVFHLKKDSNYLDCTSRVPSMIWQTFSFDQQEKLTKLYFPNIDFSSVQ